MKDSIFRKSNMDRLKSPEQLDDYIRVSNPGVWMILACVIILLIGMCVWGIFGKLNTTVTMPAVSYEGKTVCYVSQDDLTGIKAGMKVTIDESEYVITAIDATPVMITEEFEAYALHIGDLQIGEWVYEIIIDAELNDGIYEARVITESVAPVFFLLN